MTRISGPVLALVLGAVTAFVGGNYVLAQGAPTEAVVVQRDIDFDVKTAIIRAGGQIVFVNEDRFGHNVFSEIPGGEFDIGRQGPNTRMTVPFRRAGTFAVLCRIHPRMSMTVVVVP
jgi:plastocyanin